MKTCVSNKTSGRKRQTLAIPSCLFRCCLGICVCMSSWCECWRGRAGLGRGVCASVSGAALGVCCRGADDGVSSAGLPPLVNWVHGEVRYKMAALLSGPDSHRRHLWESSTWREARWLIWQPTAFVCVFCFVFCFCHISNGHVEAHRSDRRLADWWSVRNQRKFRHCSVLIIDILTVLSGQQIKQV